MKTILIEDKVLARFKNDKWYCTMCTHTEWIHPAMIYHIREHIKLTNHVREHESDDGCYGCCEDCNYDMHRCPMCGTPLAHKRITCDDCEKELNDREN